MWEKLEEESMVSRRTNLGKPKAPDCTVIMPRASSDAKFLGDIGIPNN